MVIDRSGIKTVFFTEMTFQQLLMVIDRSGINMESVAIVSKRGSVACAKAQQKGKCLKVSDV